MTQEPLVEDIQDYALNIVDTVREPLLILDTTLRVRSANRAFYQTFHVSPAETVDQLIYELGNGQWDIPDLRRLAILADVDSPLSARDVDETQGAARTLALETGRVRNPTTRRYCCCFQSAAGTRPSVVRLNRSNRFREPDTHQYLRARGATTNDARRAGECGSGRSDVLRAELAADVGSRGRSC